MPTPMEVDSDLAARASATPVVVVSAVGVAWALRPQNTHGSAFGPAKSQAKMQPRDLPVRATTLCKTNKTHKRRKKSTAASMALTGGLLGTLVLAAQVDPGLQLHVGRGLCLRGLQRQFVRMLVVWQGPREMRQWLLGR